MKGSDLGYVGGGRITAIMLQAMRERGATLDGMTVADVDQQTRTRLADRFPEITVTPDAARAANREIVFFALHPPVLKEVLPTISASLRPDSVAVSLAPAVTIDSMRQLLGGFGRIVRVIPNAPSLIHEGYNPVAFAPGVPSELRAKVESLLDVLGRHPEVNEEKLEAYAILSAMGPTYQWFQWQTLRELGASFGLTASEIDAALAATIHGAAKLFFESGMEFAVVEDMIPAKPLAGVVPEWRHAYVARLGALYRKLKAWPP